MARFFNPNPSASKKTDAVASLQEVANTTIGIPYGWFSSQTLKKKLDARFARLDQTLLDSDHLFTDLRIIQSLAHVSATSWVRSREFTHEDLTVDSLTLLRYTSLLFPSWNQDASLDLPLYIAYLESIGRSLDQAQRAELDGIVRNVLTSAVTDAGVPNPERKPAILDSGVMGITLRGRAQVVITRFRALVLDVSQIANWQALPTPLLDDQTLGLVAYQNWSVNAQLGGLFLWTYAKKNSESLKRVYGASVMLYVSCFVRTVKPTDPWMVSRLVQIEEGLGLPRGTIEVPAELLEITRNMLGYEGLSMNSVIHSLSYLGRNARSLNVERVRWMVDQAAYTNQTVPVTLFQILGDYEYIPLGILFEGLEGEVASLCKAAVWAYLYPYGALKKNQFPTTLFPSIASALKELCASLGMTTFSKYKGVYAGTNIERKDSLVTLFNQFRTDAGSSPALHNAIKALLGSTSLSGFSHVRGITTVSYNQANVGPPIPDDWDQELTNNIENHVAGSFSIGTQVLYKFLRTREINSASLNENIKHLYSLLVVIRGSLLTPPTNDALDPASFVRDIPQIGALRQYIDAVGGPTVFPAP